VAYDFYFWPTPNGYKVSIALEELELPYNLCPVNISVGEQHHADFVAISPNHKIPALVDHCPTQGAEKSMIFESGAILLYLAEKHQRLMPQEAEARYKRIAPDSNIMLFSAPWVGQWSTSAGIL
jgi:GST-like protein